MVKLALLPRGWWRNTDIWMPIIGIPIGFAFAFLILLKMQEWVAHYQIEPIVAFFALNALGLLAIYLSIKARNWASKHYSDRAITAPKAVTNPPTNVKTIVQTN